MDANLITAMKAELGQLEAKAAAIRSVIALYSGEVVKPQSGSTVAPVIPLQRPAQGSVAASVLQIARRLIEAANGAPVPTMQILDTALAEGVAIEGTVPRNVVSSILSRSEDFVANGRIGWTLKVHGASGPNGNGEPQGSPEIEGEDVRSVHPSKPQP